MNATELTRPSLPIGVYRDLPSESYHGRRAASSTILRELMRSPAHAWAAMTIPKEATPDMIFGEAVHLAVLQPDLFPDRFAVSTPCAAKKKDGEKCTNAGVVSRGGEWFCGVRGHDPLKGAPSDDPRASMTQDDWDRAMRMRDAIMRHKAASEILNARTDTELSCFWRDDATGVYCKARSDIVIPDVLADLKTLRSGGLIDASPAGFAAALGDRRLDIQAGHYATGFIKSGVPVGEFQWIAAEKKAPFGVGFYSLRMTELSEAIDEVWKLLELYADCEADAGREESKRNGGWARCYSQGVVEVTLPKWTRKT